MPKNILIIRRDNIGDLVCTTPLISTLRKSFPDANIDVLVNSYNAPVIENNPHIDNVYVYKKAKHLTSGESKFKVYFERFRTYFKIWRKSVDVAILAGGSDNERALKVAKLVRARRIIGYRADQSQNTSRLTDPIDINEAKGLHEVELTNLLAKPLGVIDEPHHLSLIPSKSEVNAVEDFLKRHGHNINCSPIGVHVSARKPSNRWSADNYVDLIHRLWNKYRHPVMLFWSPGSKDNPLHPGDDELANYIKDKCHSIPLLLFHTEKLAQLIAGISVCNAFICSDGGAMHLAAATGRPVLCFFGDSDATRWHPWRVPFKLIQKPSLQVVDISTDEAFLEFTKLLGSSK